MTDGQHARLAPSSAGVWGPGGCPGSVAMQEQQPPQEPTEESREGDAAHWLLAQTLNGVKIPADAIADNGVPITDEMREAIQEIVQDVTDTLKYTNGGGGVRIEQRQSAASTIHPDNWGTPDVVVIQRAKRTLHIWDFKYGHRFVDVFRNWQLVNYAAAVIETEGLTDWRDWTFTFTIAQPRCYARDELGGTLREWFTTGTEMAGLFDQLREAAHLASQPNAPCSTGPQCRDCTAAWDCEANQRAGGAAIHMAHSQQSLGMDAAAIGLEAKVLAETEEFLKARRVSLDAKVQALINQGQRVPYHRIDMTKPREVFDKARIDEVAGLVAMFTDGVVRMGVALPTPRECIKQGVDEAVIRPYVTRAPAAQKLVRFDDTTAAKIFGRRD